MLRMHCITIIFRGYIYSSQLISKPSHLTWVVIKAMQIAVSNSNYCIYTKQESDELIYI